MTATASPVSMDDLVALCKRRGFIYPASEIYGGINGFWDYGPMGVELKNNLRDAWWHDMVHCPPDGTDGQPLNIVGLDSSIIQNPKTWEASGHVGGFSDPMVDCRETKSRYRADQVLCLGVRGDTQGQIYAFLEGDDESREVARKKLEKYVKRALEDSELDTCSLLDLSSAELDMTVGPDTKAAGTLTEPREFNLMFQTEVGAVRSDDSTAYLRPETAQGIFLNYQNIVDTMRVKMPFGIAQIGKAFRNEVTPRNFIFRSREFEQMEIEWFCHEDDVQQWYEYWCDARRRWWFAMGLTEDSLRMRQHSADELAHYAKAGAGTFDIEYRFPFTWPDYGELEGVAHRGNYDLTRHAAFSGKKLAYFDQQRNERYLPHVIEPSAGLSRGTLAVLCDAYTPDDRPSKVFMKFHPRLAPIKAAVFPLVKKDGMPEVAQVLYRALRRKWTVQYDAKQSVGKRYARMDEAGTPYCFTIDGQSLEDQTVTVRDRDTASQERIALDQVEEFLTQRLE
ncbi:MAG: glycine--tRNA ligase [Phycisphaerales bacterium]|nr:glycine--tRNA ligase [Phycisphaerales bacterium]